MKLCTGFAPIHDSAGGCSPLAGLQLAHAGLLGANLVSTGLNVLLTLGQHQVAVPARHRH